MRYYIVKYKKCEDPRELYNLDTVYDDYDEAVRASIELEMDPDIYLSWVDEIMEDTYEY